MTDVKVSFHRNRIANHRWYNLKATKAKIESITILEYIGPSLGGESPALNSEFRFAKAATDDRAVKELESEQFEIQENSFIDKNAVYDPYPDRTNEEVALTSIESQIRELQAKKKILSQFDTTGSILLSIINIITELTEFVSSKNLKEIEKNKHVPRDKTYKISAKVIISFNLYLYVFCI